MKNTNNKDQCYLLAQKKVKSIKGFYTHVASTLFIVPFNVFINLTASPQFQWFWYFIAAWFIGLFIHWIVVFKLSKIGKLSNWKENKLKEILGEDVSENEVTKELFYIDAKKKTKEIKGFYVFLIINIISIPSLIYFNLKFVPEFQFFWFAIIGMLFPLFMMWLNTFGFEKIGFGKKWEENKINEILFNN